VSGRAIVVYLRAFEWELEFLFGVNVLFRERGREELGSYLRLGESLEVL
jgi:hypothetical protein